MKLVDSILMRVEHNFFLHRGIVARHTVKPRVLSKRPKIGFQYQLSLNAGQKNCGAFCNPFDLHLATICH